jgi:hypothetical protein
VPHFATEDTEGTEGRDVVGGWLVCHVAGLGQWRGSFFATESTEGTEGVLLCRTFATEDTEDTEGAEGTLSGVDVLW